MLRQTYKIKVFLLLSFSVLISTIFSQNNKSDTIKIRIDSVNILGEKKEEINLENKSSIKLEEEKISSNLSSLLHKNSKFYIKNYGIGQLSSISIKGFNASQTDINWNDVKLNSPMLGQSDLSLITLGANSEIYSSEENADNISGSINMNYNTAFKTKNELNFDAFAGSFATGGGSLRYLYSSNKIYSNSLFSYISSKNNYTYKNPSLPGNTISKQKNAESSLINFEKVLAYKISHRNQIKLFTKYFYADRNIAPSLFETNATESQKDMLALAKIEWLHTNNRLNIVMNTAYVYQTINYKFSNKSLPILSSANSWQTNIRFKHYWKNSLHYHFKLNNSFETGKTPNYTSLKTRNKLLFDNDLFYKHKGLTLSIGFAEMLIDKKLSPFLPKTSLKYSFQNQPANIFFKADYKAKAHYPTLNDLYWNPGGNINLKTESSHNLNLIIGIDKSINQIHFSNKFEYFSIWAKNYIQWRPTVSSYWSPTNIAAVYSRGFNNNFSFSIKFKKEISTFLNLDYSFTRTTQKESTIQLLYVPFTQLNSIIGFKSKWINFSINQHYTSKRFADVLNTNSLKAYYLLGFNLYNSIKFKNKDILYLGFELKNITNITYYQVINRPLPGINFNFTVKYKFDFTK